MSEEQDSLIVIPDEDSLLTLDFDGGTREQAVAAYPVTETLVALQQMYVGIAGTANPVLEDLLQLPVRQRQQLFRLYVYEAHVSSLHLKVGPNYDLARSIAPRFVGALGVAFRAFSKDFFADVQQIKRGEYTRPISEPNHKAIRRIGRAIRPDRMTLKLGLPIIASCECTWDIDKRVEAYERAQKEHDAQRTIVEIHANDVVSAPLLGQYASRDNRVAGPYSGVILDILSDEQVIILQCDDYVQPIPCYYEPSYNKIVERLHHGQRVSVYGIPRRDGSARRDMPPREIIRADISLH